MSIGCNKFAINEFKLLKLNVFRNKLSNLSNQNSTKILEVQFYSPFLNCFQSFYMETSITHGFLEVKDNLIFHIFFLKGLLEKELLVCTNGI